MTWWKRKVERVRCGILAIRLVWRCWRISRKFGLPFDAVLEMHLKGLHMILDHQLEEWKRAEAARNN